ncbi:MAG: hypothetical protein RI935_201 [Candidatus Parcubacteria bacterium]|jgi:magnesium chelatase family protein
MSVATVTSAHIVGLDVEKVNVEVDVTSGLYSFSIVGLPDKSVDESKDRIISALRNSYLKNPKTENQKITVSLSPAHIKKEGTHFDLPIVLAYLLASKQLHVEQKQVYFFGELSLTGSVLPVKGILGMVEYAKRQGAQSVYVPYDNKEEASLVEDILIYPCQNLRELYIHLGGTTDTGEVSEIASYTSAFVIPEITSSLDFGTIKGQEVAKRALIIAATGNHNIALYGPPGTGKTMLAKAFSQILPPLSQEEIRDVTKVHSLVKKINAPITHAPFRAPHHTASYVSLVGGGASPKPGEITLAHRGVLFLDEFPEFDKKVLESLREPLEERTITISRAKGSYTFPASVLLVAAMNPCPCGYYGSNIKPCTCSLHHIQNYSRKLSGPIIDRIDLWVPVESINYNELHKEGTGTDSTTIRNNVIRGRSFGTKRRSTTSDNKPSQKLTLDQLIKECDMEESVSSLLKKLAEKATLSPRSYYRILSVARTIADLRESSKVENEDILEAFQYRPKIYEG